MARGSRVVGRHRPAPAPGGATSSAAPPAPSAVPLPRGGRRPGPPPAPHTRPGRPPAAAGESMVARSADDARRGPLPGGPGPPGRPRRARGPPGAASLAGPRGAPTSGGGGPPAPAPRDRPGGRAGGRPGYGDPHDRGPLTGPGPLTEPGPRAWTARPSRAAPLDRRRKGSPAPPQRAAENRKLRAARASRTTAHAPSSSSCGPVAVIDRPSRETARRASMRGVRGR